MIVLRPLGAAVEPSGAMSAYVQSAYSPTLAATLDPSKGLLMDAYSGDRRTVVRAATAATQATSAVRPDCEAACAGDGVVAADPETFSRCVSICTSTGDVDRAIRNAKGGTFCRQVIDAVGPTIGASGESYAGRLDYQHMFETCQADPDAFLAQLRSMGIDLGVSFEPWLKRNWKLVAIGGAALVGLLVLRKLRR